MDINDLNSQDLIKARAKLGFSMREMAEALNTNYATYTDWESGRRNMLGTTKKLICILVDLQGSELGKKYGV